MNSSRIIVGAPGASGGAANSGAAYIFDFEGNLLAKVMDPQSADGNNFGFSVGTSGPSFLVGAWGTDADAANAGAAYVIKGVSDTGIADLDRNGCVESAISSSCSTPGRPATKASSSARTSS